MRACQISPNVLCSGMLVKYRWETIPPTKEKSTSGKLFQNILILRKVEHSSNSVRFGECIGYLKCSISSQLRSYTINSLSLSPTLSQLAQMGTHTHTHNYFLPNRKHCLVSGHTVYSQCLFWKRYLLKDKTKVFLHKYVKTNRYMSAWKRLKFYIGNIHVTYWYHATEITFGKQD